MTPAGDLDQEGARAMLSVGSAVRVVLTPCALAVLLAGCTVGTPERLRIVMESRCLEVGASERAIVNGVYKSGHEKRIYEIDWSFSDDDLPPEDRVAIYNPEYNEVRAQHPGSVTMTATWNDLSTSEELQVVVNQALCDVVEMWITPKNPALALGIAFSPTAEGSRHLGPDYAGVDLTHDVTWTVEPPGIFSFQDATTLVPVAHGCATLTATLGQFTASTTIIGADETNVSGLSTWSIAPEAPTIAPGEGVTFSIDGLFADGSILNLASSGAWASSDPTVASVSTAGVADGVANGSATISASCGPFDDSTLLTVGTCVPPAAPTSLVAAFAVEPSPGILVTWEPVVGAASYNLYFSDTSGVTKQSGTRLENVTSPYRHSAGLVLERTYFYVVTAVGACGESAESGEDSATFGIL
jgi:hypothetical protein